MWKAPNGQTGFTQTIISGWRQTSLIAYETDVKSLRCC